MPTIDSDTHVIECERTWQDYDGPAEFRPRFCSGGWNIGGSGRSDCWLIDGRVIGREDGDESLSMAIKCMDDIDGRLRRMDELGVDVQVLFPGIFLTFVTDRPEVQVPLCRSYNRWLADVWEREKRFRWVIVPPLTSMSDTLAELEFGRSHGACGIVMLGLEGERVLSDPYFFPLYEKAASLDLPICIHAGTGNKRHTEIYFSAPLLYGVLPIQGAFHSLLSGGIPQRFPRLKVAFLEGGAQWVPDMIRWNIRTQKLDRPETTALGDLRFYVAVRTDNDLAYLQRLGIDNFLFGTDFSHSDPNHELDGIRKLKDDPNLNPRMIDRMFDANPRALYNI